MKILLDTHILLWALQDSEELPKSARYMIADPDNEIYYSLASLWEVQIKHMSHPKEMSLDAKQLEEYCRESGYHLLSIRSEDIQYLTKLSAPSGFGHKDPFDRIMICQAVVDDMLFMTRDKQIVKYEEPCIFGV